MRSSKKCYSTIGTIMLAVVFSTTACASSDPSAETAAPNASETASKSATATPRPSQTAAVTPSAPSSASVAPAPTPAPAPSPAINPQPATESFVVTAEDAIDIIAEYHDNNPDLQYQVKDNGDGTFDVSVTSLSIVAQGGDGNAGTYIVTQSRAYFPK